MDSRIQLALERSLYAINLSHAYGYYPGDAQTAELDALVAQVQPMIDEFANQPYRGKGLGNGYLNHRDYRTSWADLMRQLCDGRGTGGLDWVRRLEALFDTAGLDPTTMLAWAVRVEDRILRDHLLLHIATDMALQGDEAAVVIQIKPRLRPDMAHRADRVLLNEFARRGDVEAFQKLLKTTDKRSERNSLVNAIIFLVERVSAEKGIDAGLALCARKGFGDRYHATAMRSFAESHNLVTVRNWIAANRNLVETPGLEEQLLVAAWCKGPKTAEEDNDDFDALFTQVETMDRALRAGAARLRDSLLLELGIAVGPGARRQLCRRKIGNVSLKRELD